MRSDVLTKHEVEGAEKDDFLFNSKMMRVHTSLIAQVVSFDEAKNTVDVQPLIMRVMMDDVPRRLPIIKNCPVMFYGAGGYVITFKPRPGDVCDLVVNERSLDVWKKTGGIVDSGMSRHHDMTDSKAYFGLNHYGNVYTGLRAGIDVRTREGDTSFHLEDGTITLIVGGTTVATFTSGGITFGVPVNGPSGTFGGKVVETHTHGGVQSGSAQTDPPT